MRVDGWFNFLFCRLQWLSASERLGHQPRGRHTEQHVLSFSVVHWPLIFCHQAKDLKFTCYPQNSKMSDRQVAE